MINDSPLVTMYSQLKMPESSLKWHLKFWGKNQGNNTGTSIKYIKYNGGKKMPATATQQQSSQHTIILFCILHSNSSLLKECKTGLSYSIYNQLTNSFDSNNDFFASLLRDHIICQ